MDEAPDSGSRARRLLTALRADAEFRATFLGAIVLPLACGVALLAWITLSLLRSG